MLLHNVKYNFMAVPLFISFHNFLHDDISAWMPAWHVAQGTLSVRTGFLHILSRTGTTASREGILQSVVGFRICFLSSVHLLMSCILGAVLRAFEFLSVRAATAGFGSKPHCLLWQSCISNIFFRNMSSHLTAFSLRQWYPLVVASDLGSRTWVYSPSGMSESTSADRCGSCERILGSDGWCTTLQACDHYKTNSPLL